MNTIRLSVLVVMWLLISFWSVLQLNAPVHWSLALPSITLGRFDPDLDQLEAGRPVLEKRLGVRVLEMSERPFAPRSALANLRKETAFFSRDPFGLPSVQDRSVRCTPLGWPAFGTPTSLFGQRVSPLHGNLQFHAGIDIANDEGTSIRATADGTVVYADWMKGYGKIILLDHENGYMTLYGHNSYHVVKEGDSVQRGQTIAYMGKSGDSTGAHVHYEVWRNYRCINPAKFLDPPLKKTPAPLVASPIVKK